MDFAMKYYFVNNVRLDNGEVTAQKLGFDTPKLAEIKFHDEVSYGLKLNNLVLGYYAVVNERGDIYAGLKKVIDNIEED